MLFVCDYDPVQEPPFINQSGICEAHYSPVGVSRRWGGWGGGTSSSVSSEEPGLAALPECLQCGVCLMLRGNLFQVLAAM